MGRDHKNTNPRVRKGDSSSSSEKDKTSKPNTTTTSSSHSESSVFSLSEKSERNKKHHNRRRKDTDSSKCDTSQSHSKSSSDTKSSSSPSKKTSSMAKDHRGDIKLLSVTEEYFVKTSDFAASSLKFQKELAVHAHASSIDLRQFDSTTVRVLAEYIENKKIKTDISFYSLAELMKIAQFYEMENLRFQLEKFISKIAADDLGILHQVMLIMNSAPVTLETEEVILAIGARNFMQLAAQKTFQQLPFNVAITLFARCDLNVTDELQVVDSMLLWLAGQPNLPTVVPALFYLVRHDFIHSMQKAFIIERARELGFPKEALKAIERSFESKNGARVCMLRSHRKLTRCGNPVISHLDEGVCLMPLSIPREAMLYKKPTEAAPTSEENSRSFESSEKRPIDHAKKAHLEKDKGGKAGMHLEKDKGGKAKSTRHQYSPTKTEKADRKKHKNHKAETEAKSARHQPSPTVLQGKSRREGRRN